MLYGEMRSKLISNLHIHISLHILSERNDYGFTMTKDPKGPHAKEYCHHACMDGTRDVVYRQAMHSSTHVHALSYNSKTLTSPSGRNSAGNINFEEANANNRAKASSISE